MKHACLITICLLLLINCSGDSGDDQNTTSEPPLHIIFITDDLKNGDNIDLGAKTSDFHTRYQFSLQNHSSMPIQFHQPLVTVTSPYNAFTLSTNIPDDTLFGNGEHRFQVALHAHRKTPTNTGQISISYFSQSTQQTHTFEYSISATISDYQAPDLTVIDRYGTSYDTGTPYDFSEVAATDILTADLNIKQANDAPVDLTGTPPITITGADAGDFRVIIQPTNINLMDASDIASTVIEFAPSTPGLKTATLSIPFNGSIHTCPIQGTAITEGTGWQPMGPNHPKENDYAVIDQNALAVEDGIAYVAFAADGTSNHANVMKFDNGSWQYVGLPGFTSDSANQLKLAVTNGIPYVAYCNDGGDISVMRYTGGQWEFVGPTGFHTAFVYRTIDENGYPISTISTFDFIIRNGQPHLAFVDTNQRLKVSRFASGSWSDLLVDDPTHTARIRNYVQIKASTTNIYVSYTPEDHAGTDPRTRVLKYDGSSWSQFGPDITGLDDRETPMVASENDVITIANNHLTSLQLLRSDGSAWSIAGNIAGASIINPELALVNATNDIYVAYRDLFESDMYMETIVSDARLIIVKLLATDTIQSFGNDGVFPYNWYADTFYRQRAITTYCNTTSLVVSNSTPFIAYSHSTFEKDYTHLDVMVYRD